MDAKKFRTELKKIMPGYNWTVHRGYKSDTHVHATGVQTVGLNRLSTLQVDKHKNEDDNTVRYIVKSSGYGKRAPWLFEGTGGTLARALRGSVKMDIKKEIFRRISVKKLVVYLDRPTQECVFGDNECYLCDIFFPRTRCDSDQWDGHPCPEEVYTRSYLKQKIRQLIKELES